MAVARKRLISLSDTKYYHCISRCVRRAFLCGIDELSGQSYEHRRVWVEQKLFALGKSFCIDVCAYAVMSNHTHLVLYVDDNKAKRLSDKAVIIRWHKLRKGTVLTQKFVDGAQLTNAERVSLQHTIIEYRKRLASISWFMSMLNEDIARKANKEDNCKGRFWEGRFKSHALLDEAAVMACMAYVDLNPVRAGAAETPETSEYTSIKRRIKSAAQGIQPKQLLRFTGKPTKYRVKGLPFELKSYLELIDRTGRCLRDSKSGHINQAEHPILMRLNISSENWLKLTTEFTRVFHGAVGKPSSHVNYCKSLNRKRRTNISNCALLLS